MRALLFGLLIAGAAIVGDAEACRLPRYGPPEAEAWKGMVPLEPPAVEREVPNPKPPEPAVDSDEVIVDSCWGPRTREGYLRWTAPAGRQVGYKAGLTSQAAQSRFGASGPLLGLLFDSMLLPSGAEVSAAYGARPVWEADFLLVVGHERINEATTRNEALATLSGYRPFIELPDLIYAPTYRITARDLAYINVGARLGVAGEERPLPSDALTALAAMRVRAFDGSGALLAEGRGSDALGHPLDVVLWVRDAVHREGGRLKAGDVISVGAFTPLTPPRAGQTIRVRYEGLAGDPEVSVRFR